MRWSLDRETAFTAISALIIAILGTQFVVGLVDTGRWGWPMLAYPMYKHAHFDGDRLDDYDVNAVWADGTTVRIDPDELGMSFWIFRRNVITPIDKGSVARLAPLIARYCEQSQGRLVRLEVVDQGVALSRHGPAFGLEPQRYAATDVSCE